MKLFAILMLGASLRAEAACPCMATPATPALQQQKAAKDKPAYPGLVPAYGWGCAAHDDQAGNKPGNTSTCGTSNKTGPGEADDWCKDKYCIVDPKTCDTKTRLLSYTANPDDHFSYEACDANFKGNGWVGRCMNCEGVSTTGKKLDTSFCTCEGADGCKCKIGSTKQESASGKPAYPGVVPAYGWGCKAHDQGQDSCGTSNHTGTGKKDDWCMDKFCIVDKATCKFKPSLLSYTKKADDYFSYETCDDKFAGNGWVGRCKCAAPDSNTYCSCPDKVISLTSSAFLAHDFLAQVILALAVVIRA